MSMETYLNFSQDNLWSELWPELSLCLGALFVLGVDLFSNSAQAKKRAGSFAILFQFLLLCAHLFDYLLLDTLLTVKVFLACLSTVFIKM